VGTGLCGYWGDRFVVLGRRRGIASHGVEVVDERAKDKPQALYIDGRIFLVLYA